MLDGTRAYLETNTDEMSVVNAHLNDLPVKFSVGVSEGQDKLLTMYWLPKLHKRPYKARSKAYEGESLHRQYVEETHVTNFPGFPRRNLFYN